ncbi:MAG: 3'-5' exonuclease [Methanobrevibacter sp.]|nr:3'-5' exonuclease [Methanosphaera sp.]MBR0369253.1 3'-5' exonuclease [Methanobrevibacter sp.]
MRTVFFDTETTGLKPGEDTIIELALLIYEDGVLIEEYDQLLQVDGKLSKDIVRLTGITNEMLYHSGIPERMVAEKLWDELGYGGVWIAHNCQFDLNFIYYFLSRFHGEDDVEKVLRDILWLDTLTVLRDRKKYPHNLQSMVGHYELDGFNFHCALDDAKALREVVPCFIGERDDLRRYVNVFGYLPKYGLTGKQFDFITYTPQAFNDGLVDYNDILPFKNNKNKFKDLASKYYRFLNVDK